MFHEYALLANEIITSTTFRRENSSQIAVNEFLDVNISFMAYKTYCIVRITSNVKLVNNTTRIYNGE